MTQDADDPRKPGGPEPTLTDPGNALRPYEMPRTLAGETPIDPLPLTVDSDAQRAIPIEQPISFTLSELTSERLSQTRSKSSESMPRQSVPGFEIIKELGRGGMGVVYLARQSALNRLVALKMILSGAHASPTERERFRREAEAVAQLKHLNIVQIYDIGEVEDCPYLALEFIDGGNLASLLTGDPWPSKLAAGLIETLARAMHYAHQQGIIHRDLKPGNVLVNLESGSRNNDWKVGMLPHGAVLKITDFGLAKRVVTGQTPTGDAVASFVEKTRTGAVMGTPSYIAPEQAAGKNRELGPAVDIYALGAILYELLTGRPPFKGETPLDTVLQVMNDDPVAPSRLQPKIARDLETICLKCLQKTPSRRYLHSGELADDLSRFQRGEPIQARPVGTTERLIKWAKRHPTTAWLGLFSALVVLILLTASLYFNFELRAANERTRKETVEAKRLQKRAEDEEKRTAEALKKLEDSIKEIERGRQEVIRREEINRRGAYALQLSQAAGLVDRDPRRAIELLNQLRNEYRDFTWHYLRRVCNREMHVWKDEMPRPVHGISGVEFSPDGSLVAAACWDSTVRIYEIYSRRMLAVLISPGGLMLNVAFSPDGETVAASSDDGRIVVWELQKSSLPKPDAPVKEIVPFAELKGHRGAVKALAFSPKSNWLVSGGDDGDLRFWPIPPSPSQLAIVGGTPLSLVRRTCLDEQPFDLAPVIKSLVPVEGHTKGIWSLRFSHDGQRLYTGGEDRTVRVWDLKPMPQDFPTSEVLATFRDPIGSLAYSQFNDRSMLAIGTNSQDDPSIRLWDLEERRELHRLRGHTQSINGLSFNAEGNLLLSGSSDRTVRVWDILTGQEKMLLRGHQESVRSVAFSPTQPFAVSGDLQQNLHLWTLAPQREETFELPVTSAIDSATLSPDGKRLAVGEKSGLIRVWSRVAEVETSIPTQQELLLKGHRSRVIRLDFSPDGNSLASASLDGEVRIWDLQRKATVNKDGIAELIDARPPMKSPGPPRGIFLLKDRLILGGETGLKVIQLPGSEVKELPIEGKFLRAVALSGDNQKLATTDGRFLQFWNLNTLEQECTKLVTALQPREIVSLAFESLVLDPNRPAQPGWRLVTAYETGKAHFWDVLPVVTPEGTEPPKEKLQVSESHELFGHGERIDTLAFARNGKTLVTGSRDRTIKFWDPLTGADRGTLTGHTNGVVLVTFLPNQRALLTVGREGMAKLWKLD